jgi:hypothetical protein
MCFGDQPLVCETQRTSPYPHVRLSGDLFGLLPSFVVEADGSEIVSCSDIISGVTVTFLMYWLFDIKYPKIHFGLLSFLDTFIFQKKGVRASQKVLGFINQF